MPRCGGLPALCNFYPRPPRGGRHQGSGSFRTAPDFYPRPPRGGRRIWSRRAESRKRFLSTPSARRATGFIDIAVHDLLISIHALREEGDVGRPSVQAVVVAISIHALREEGDAKFVNDGHWTNPFLSTPSARRATRTSSKSSICST